jgi:predicted MFS family arabinose efflux permease
LAGKLSIKDYRPASAAFLLMMSMALTTTALSFFVEPVCDALGIGRGTFTVYYSVMTASGTLAIPVLGQTIGKRGIRAVVAVSAVWVAAGFAAFSFSEAVWMFYAAGGCMGIFGTACVSLCASVIVQQNYSGSRASGILGVVMAGSGAGGMIVSLVLPGLIRALGWRGGYRILAVCWLLLGLSALMLLGKGQGSGSAHKELPTDGMTRDQALRSPKFYLLIAVSFLLSAACGIQQQLPAVLSGYGFPSERVGVMMSFFTAALALGKIGQGFFYGRAGADRGGLAVTGIFAASFLILLVPAMALPGLAALAIGMGTATTLMPLLTRITFGNREYAAIWGILSAASNAGALVATPLFGLAYDLNDSYGAAMVTAAGLLMVTMVLMHLCFREKRPFSPENTLDRNL